MNAPVPQRIKMMTVEQLWQRVIGLEAANAKCGNAIAAAVQAERERCIEIAKDCLFDITGTSTMSAPDIIKTTRHGIAAAIRARNAQEERKS